jgi:hypothetical protein
MRVTIKVPNSHKLKAIIIPLLSLLVVGCNGGGGAPVPTESPPPPVTKSILPLNVSVSDLDNNPLPDNEIDVYKIGSFLKYKTVFTNPNLFAVTVPDGGYTDSNWFNANPTFTRIATFGEITGEYYKTENADDCMNTTELAAGKSCAFYTIAHNVRNTKTTEEHFTYPLTYTINEVSDQTNKLTVHQCQETSTVNKWDCSNESKPSYKNQFIKYKLVSITHPFPSTGALSNSGKFAAYCAYESKPICYKQSVSYDDENKTLSFNIIESFSPKSISLIPEIGTPVINNDGSQYGALMENTSVAGVYYYDSEYPKVPAQNGGLFSGVLVTQGLNGSIIFDQEDVYNQESNILLTPTLDIKKPFNIGGFTADGTMIATVYQENGYYLVCANSIDGIHYTSRPMENYNMPTKNYKNDLNDSMFQVHNIFYGNQDFPVNLYTGKEYISHDYYFKITADKDHCSIAKAYPHTISGNDMVTGDWRAFFYDDYIKYDDYIIESNAPVKYAPKITSSENSAIGFN